MTFNVTFLDFFFFAPGCPGCWASFMQINVVPVLLQHIMKERPVQRSASWPPFHSLPTLHCSENNRLWVLAVLRQKFKHRQKEYVPWATLFPVTVTLKMYTMELFQAIYCTSEVFFLNGNNGCLHVFSSMSGRA